MAVGGFIVGLFNGSPPAPLITAGISFSLCILGRLARKLLDKIGTIHVNVLQSVRGSFGPLSVFLTLYAACILLFALIYNAINNSAPYSLRIVVEESSSVEPQFRQPVF